jgi:two-component system, sensor histidine kinase
MSNVSLFNLNAVVLYMFDSFHVHIVFLLLFLLIHDGQSEHMADLRQVQQQLIATRRQAAQNNLNKNTFISALAHDIRTPLSGIMSGLALTLDDPTLCLSQEHRDYLSMSHTSASSLLYLLNDVLDISKLDSHHLHFDRIEFDLVDAIERSV